MTSQYVSFGAPYASKDSLLHRILNRTFLRHHKDSVRILDKARPAAFFWNTMMLAGCPTFQRLIQMLSHQSCLFSENQSINRRAMLILGGMGGRLSAENHPASVISDVSIFMSRPAYSAVNAIMRESGKGHG